MELLVKISVYLVIAGISFLFFCTLSNIFSNFGNFEEKLESAVDRYLKNKKEFTAKKRQLSKGGIMYRMKDYNLAPSKYVILRIFVGFVFALIGYSVSGKLTLLAVLGGFGYFVCGWFFRHQNKRDNTDILSDLFNIYLTLKIQLASGIYIINALLSARMLITSARLKEALDELIANLSNKAIPYTESVQLFKDRFNSEEINNFCSFLLSYFYYGVSEKYLNDIMSEVNEIATESMIREEHAIESKIGTTTFLYFISILSIVIFCAVNSFGSMNIF